MPTGIFELQDKVAVVTGAGSGIGAAIARLFARQHARVVVVDLDEAAARRIASQIGGEGGHAEAIACDVAAADQVAAVFERIVETNETRNDLATSFIGV